MLGEVNVGEGKLSSNPQLNGESDMKKGISQDRDCEQTFQQIQKSFYNLNTQNQSGDVEGTRDIKDSLNQFCSIPDVDNNINNNSFYFEDSNNNPNQSNTLPQLHFLKTEQEEEKEKKEKEYKKKDSILNLSNLDGISKSDNKNIFIMDRMVTPIEQEKVMRTLKQNFVFRGLAEELLNLLIQEFIHYKFEKGCDIYKEGALGNYCFILIEGRAASFVKGFKRRDIKPFQIFGEMSLLGQTRREETVTCLSDVVVAGLETDIYKCIKTKMCESKLNEKFNFLSSLEIFKPLDIQTKYNLCKKSLTIRYPEDTVIFHKGQPFDGLYIISNGVISFQELGIEHEQIKTNNYFGHLSLIIEQSAQYDTVALKNTVCLVLRKEKAKDVLGEKFKNVLLFALFKSAISSSKSFKRCFTESVQEHLFKCFEMVVYKYKEPLIKIQSYKISNKKIFIIIDGTVFNQTNILEVYKKNYIIGEQVLFEPTYSINTDLVAGLNLITLETKVNDLEEVMEDIVGKANHPMKIFKVLFFLQGVSLFKNLSEKLLQSLAKSVVKHKFFKDSIIFKEGDIGNDFYIIAKGSVQIIIRDKVLRELEEGSYFGEVALISENCQRSATVKSKTDTIIFTLSKEEFNNIIKNKGVYEYILRKISLQKGNIELSDLYYSRFLGKGRYGYVYLVHNKKDFYALKAIKQKLAFSQPYLYKFLTTEKQIMIQMDHPFVVSLVKTIKDNNYIYYLLEYVNGTTLDSYLTKRKKIKNFEETKFYAGCLILILDYLQKKHIGHRDIKPSNLMLDSNGYLKVIDFGIAKKIENYTYTIIGTPNYMAPEILEGKGYSLTLDFWSVGICIYEIFYGYFPFGNKAKEIIDVYKDILYNELKFPNTGDKYDNINSFISILLLKDASKRCCKIKELQEHKFFDNLKWDSLLGMEIKAPNIPPTINLEEEIKKASEPFLDVIKAND